MTIAGNFERFQNVNFERSSQKLEFFKKLKYPFLFQSTVNENAILPDKIALSKVNVKTN